jgi:hypothetical protein
LHAAIVRSQQGSIRQLDPRKRKYELRQQLEQRSGFSHTTKHKQQHDIEQFEYTYLLNHPKLGKTNNAKVLLGQKLPALYQSVLHRMEQSQVCDEEMQCYKFQESDAEKLITIEPCFFLSGAQYFI